jgi:hypothetical protein
MLEGTVSVEILEQLEQDESQSIFDKFEDLCLDMRQDYKWGSPEYA